MYLCHLDLATVPYYAMPEYIMRYSTTLHRITLHRAVSYEDAALLTRRGAHDLHWDASAGKTAGDFFFDGGWGVDLRSWLQYSCNLLHVSVRLLHLSILNFYSLAGPRISESIPEGSIL